MLSRWRQWVDRVARLGVADAGSTDERIYREATNLSALLILVLACFWVATYATLGLWLSAAIPFTYQLVTLAGFVFLYLSYPGVQKPFIENELSKLTPEQRAAMEQLQAADAAARALARRLQAR